MKITIDRNGDDVHMEVGRHPMPPERFKAVCKLVGAAIGGVVLLGAIHMVGIWAIVWSVGALALVGMVRQKKLCKSRQVTVKGTGANRGFARTVQRLA